MTFGEVINQVLFLMSLEGGNRVTFLSVDIGTMSNKVGTYTKRNKKAIEDEKCVMFWYDQF